MNDLILKHRRIHSHWHKTCEEFLLGEGSLAYPYVCKCGTWTYDLDTFELKLIPRRNDQDRPNTTYTMYTADLPKLPLNRNDLANVGMDDE